MKLLLSFLLIFTVSCTEKISEELKSSTAGGAGGGSSTTGTNIMKITSTASEGLSHFLHLEGDSTKPCELTAPTTGWDAEDYAKNSVYAADCVLDVEELDLFQTGAGLKIDIDKGLCEYISYRPLRFAQYQPGVTRRKTFTASCDAVCGEINVDFCAGFDNKTYKNYTGATVYLNELASNGFLTNQTFGESCQFDYSAGGGPNCDQGKITNYPLEITSYDSTGWCDGGETPLRSSRTNQADCEFSGTWDSVGSTCTGAVPARSEALCPVVGTWRFVDCFIPDNKVNIVALESQEALCGGNTNTCFSGPGAEFGDGVSGLLYNNDSISSFSKEIEIKAPYDLGRTSNKYIASYSRMCVNESLKTPGSFATNGVAFKGYEVEETASYSRYFGYTVDSDNNGIDDYTVLGDHPFLSTNFSGGRPKYSSKQYYAFYCLDQSRDVKAQIRVHVREWDRAFLKTFSFLDNVSDVDRTPVILRFMDNDEVNDGDEDWNDRGDWDDFFGGRGLCSDLNYTTKLSCQTNAGTWTYTVDPMFPNEDCRTLDRRAEEGTCSNIAFTNKEDCLLNVPRCASIPAVTDRIDCGTCSDGTSLTHNACAAAVGSETWTYSVWDDNPWTSDDDSSNNFPNGDD